VDVQINISLVTTDAARAKLHSGDRTHPPTILETALFTRKATLKLPAAHEKKKIPKDTIPSAHTIPILSWHQYINNVAPSVIKATIYETITSHPSIERMLKRDTKPNTYDTDTYVIFALSEQMYTPYNVLEIQDHKHINKHTTYLVTLWSQEIFIKEQIDVCMIVEAKHIHTFTQYTSQKYARVTGCRHVMLCHHGMREHARYYILVDYKQSTQPQRDSRDCPPKRTNSHWET
jgi:4-hydroxyphenylpyruvate dioxygenase-like putative hemolysin